MFRDALLASIDRHIPHKNGCLAERNFQGTTKRKMRKRRRLYDRARQTKKQEDLTKHREVRNQTKQSLVDAHDYVKNLIDTTVNEHDMDYAVDTYNAGLTAIIDNAPIKTRTVIVRPHTPWRGTTTTYDHISV